jgi:hypothetical protein
VGAGSDYGRTSYFSPPVQRPSCWSCPTLGQVTPRCLPKVRNSKVAPGMSVPTREMIINLAHILCQRTGALQEAARPTVTGCLGLMEA